MNSPLVLRGGLSHGPSHLAKIRSELQEVSNRDDVRLHAEYVHLLDIERSLNPEELQVVTSLLDYGTSVPDGREQLPLRCTVVPRLGTTSPWSSKATDVFKLCNLDSVRRVERGIRWHIDLWSQDFLSALYDRMTESVVFEENFAGVFRTPSPGELRRIDLSVSPREAIEELNIDLGLALAQDEILYLTQIYDKLRRNPTDVELMMFAQANSEHCRHKVFNASWNIDGRDVPDTLFQKIRSTTAAINGRGIRSAYQDNAAVIDGSQDVRFGVSPFSIAYGDIREPVDTVMKVETHNHPTAISPYAGAATGSGGEIRDEGAVGSGSKPKAGLVGYTTSHLEIGTNLEPWELGKGKPDSIASSAQIMSDGPIGAAAYNNEYGRPALLGYFRTFESASQFNPESRWGYHKPIMIAGGVGSVFRQHVNGESVERSCALVVLGGPAMLIGLGGGAASSMSSGESSSELDFASVQRDNAELERRCQEVIDRCTASLDRNPIAFIHDVGAGGLSNALPELIHDIGTGGKFELRDVPNADIGMSPMEIWCNEAQERYVLAIPSERLELFRQICERERCPYAVVGHTLQEKRIELNDALLDEQPIDLNLDVIFGKPPRMRREFISTPRSVSALDLGHATLDEAISRVLRFPAVGSKKFLVTIGDRSITGLVAREQMVGPYQVPVADAAVTIAGYETYSGEAMSMGERSPLAVLNPASSACMAIAEALTNLASVRVESLDRVVLSANWMACVGFGDEDQALHEAVSAAADLCREIGIAIPVGKDSLSMRTTWQEEEPSKEVVSPVSLIVSAFAPVPDVRVVSTPQLRSVASELLLIELDSQQRLGGSCLAQVYGQFGDSTPDVQDPQKLRRLFEIAMQVHDEELVLAMHDRSDGGLFVSVLEMAIAGRIGIELSNVEDWKSELFSEEVGLIYEALPGQANTIERLAADLGLVCRRIGRTRDSEHFEVYDSHGELIYRESLRELERRWTSTSHSMQRLRDDSDCADEEFALIGEQDPGLSEDLKFSIDQSSRSTRQPRADSPRVAILRDQGVNGQVEMAAAFHAAGFECDDVHMTDIFSGRVSLSSYRVLAACGGFSYGDVLGAGGGWAKSILFNDEVCNEFGSFFGRSDTLTLGVCNGCQMLSRLKSLIPGTSDWPTFERNKSDQFEGRTVQVRIEESDSPWLLGMGGSRVQVPVAHGEGRTVPNGDDPEASPIPEEIVTFRYVDGFGDATDTYPMNPNGSVDSIAGVSSTDGRVLILMPHPERVFRTVQNSWFDPALLNREFSPWFQLFRNAYNAVA